MIERVVTIGEGLAILRGSQGDPLWRAARLAVGTGGAEANVAMTLARNGVPVTWAGRLGDDPFGRRVRRELRAEGVDTAVVWDPVRATGLIVKGPRGDGRTEVFNYRTDSAGSALSIGDFDELALPLDERSLLHVTGITPALSPDAAAAVGAAVARTRAAGGSVSFDVNHRAKLWAGRSPRATFRAIAAQADIVFVSVDEVHFLVDDDPSGWAEDAGPALAALRRAGFAHAVVTAGSAGATAFDPQTSASVAALAVDAVDSVGAGDAFVGGYLAGWILGEDLDGRLQRARIAGAAACRHPGDWEGAVDVSGLGADGTSLDPVLR